MIVGLGVDLVDIARFERTLERTPRLLERLFSPAEQTRSPRSLAARYAAKEALIKALGDHCGITGLHLSMSHDAGFATAFVVAESDAAAARVSGTEPA